MVELGGETAEEPRAVAVVAVDVELAVAMGIGAVFCCADVILPTSSPEESLFVPDFDVAAPTVVFRAVSRGATMPSIARVARANACDSRRGWMLGIFGWLPRGRLATNLAPRQTNIPEIPETSRGRLYLYTTRKTGSDFLL